MDIRLGVSEKESRGDALDQQHSGIFPIQQ
jgi:hypothetical protein